MDDLAEMEAAAETKIHHMIKSYRISNGGLLFSAKLDYRLRIPACIPHGNLQAALKKLMILPNEERKIECQLEAFIGHQQAKSTAFANRIIEVLDTNKEALEVDSIQRASTLHAREPKFDLRPSGVAPGEGVIPKHMKTGMLDSISIRLVITTNRSRGKQEQKESTWDPFAEDGCGDGEEYRLLQDLAANRLPEATVTSLDWFVQRFLSPGLAQAFPLIFNQAVKAYYRREAAGVTKVASSMKNIIQSSKSKRFKQEAGHLFKRLQYAMRENVVIRNFGGCQDESDPEAESVIAMEVDRMKEEDEEEEGEGETFERLLTESMMRLCVEQCSAPKIKCQLPDPSFTLDDATENAGSENAMAVEQVMLSDITASTTLAKNTEQDASNDVPWHRPVSLAYNPITSGTQSDTDDMMSDIVDSSIQAVDSLMSEDEASISSDASCLSEGVWSFPTVQRDPEPYDEDGESDDRLRRLRALDKTSLAKHHQSAMDATSLDDIISDEEYSVPVVTYALEGEGYDKVTPMSIEEGSNDTESLYDF